MLVTVKIREFRIKNFKGIKDATIEISSDVITLIGLNESGKTTVLEALSHYISSDKNTSELVSTVQKASSSQDIIPISKRAAFSDQIKIIADVLLDDDDVRALNKYYLDEHSMIIHDGEIKRNFTIEKVYNFEDSHLISTISNYGISFPVSEKGKKKKIVLGAGAFSDETEKKLWVGGVLTLQERHPKIAYFPTFLFNFPDRIYISNTEENSSQINSYYTQVIQDVLDSEGSNLNLKKHIIDRVDKFKKGDELIFTFVSKFSSSIEKKQIDAVMQKASSEMTRVIFGAWNEILGRRAAGKRIQIDWAIDSNKDNSIYLEIYIIDGESRYSISERSLGFRWFFSFLLFTQFRRNRKDGGATIFLFDEPAANLHSKAQVKLLESFTRIAGGLTKIIYSTHSHYMINPYWLENSYIISNSASEEDAVGSFDSLLINDTDVVATKYRTFVGSHPSQTTYFQPVLDALDVGFSPIVASSKALIVEGKFDYFPILYFRRLLGCGNSPEIFPANGAGNAGRIITLFRGWGVDFRLILDGDLAGQKGKDKYIEDYLLSSNEVVTLGDINVDLIGKSFESIFKEDVRSAIKTHFSIEEIKKKHFSLYFQELFNTKSSIKFPDTEAEFLPVSKWIDKEFQ